ncbi:MAG TPA: hypothetical protein VGM90_17015 [Kofleriaceae bacterium]|jgi:hypothetical protein
MSMRVRDLVAFAVVSIAAGCGASESSNPHGQLMSIDVQPANEMVEYTGTPSTIDYTAVGHYADGADVPLDGATWTLDEDGGHLGSFVDSHFTIGGAAAGKGGVFATLDGTVGSTSVMVTMHLTTLGDGVPDDAATHFPDTSPAAAQSQTVVYPLDQAVMPTSVKSPDIQWEGANAGGGDLYRVRMIAGYATLDTILLEPPGSHFEPVDLDWQRIVGSVGTGTATITVDHWDATNGVAGGAPVNVKFIDAQVVGAIYYWHLDAGRMEKIDSMGRAPAIPNPPQSPSDAANPTNPSDNRCVACHSVSRDGRYLAGSMWGGAREGAVFDMSSNAVKTGNPAPTVAPLTEGTTYKQLFTSWNNDGTRLMVNEGNTLRVINPMTGANVTTTGTPLPAAGAAHPSWSPDGTAIAFASNTTAGGGTPAWAVDYDRSDLSIIPQTGPDAFGPAFPIVTATGSPFPAASWPTWTPDSQYVAFGQGVNSRGASGTTPYAGSLFMVNRNGGASVKLANACRGQDLCYLPNFGPFDQGGYFWLVFYSFSPYGNAQVGTKGVVRRQMWVTAIDKSKLGTGQDPSSTPYWLPEQDVTAQNMSAFWALEAPIFKK